jgi:arsenical pump membrane protein
VTLRVALGLIIFVATLALIVIRPRGVTEAAAALGGAALLLLGGFIGPVEALRTVGSQWNVYGFFLGLMTISALADHAGVFEAVTQLAARWAGGSAMRLYLGVFLVGVVITAFLSNDATALILTPVVYALVTRLRLPALPFMFACTFIGDTASFLLPVSNPINILVLDAFGGGLGVFLRFLLLPALVCVTLNIVVFMWLFRRDLRLSYEPGAIEAIEAAARPAQFRFTLIGLGLIALGYVIASAAQLPLSLVALGGAGLLLVGAAWYRQLEWTRVRREISWSLFGFISGMFIVVRAMEDLGLTKAFGQGLLRLGGGSALGGALLTTFGTALGANLINNVPMALVMISTLNAIPVISAAHQSLVYSVILGADLGPNLTTVGSLATMLWLLILRRKGLDVSTLDYIKLGLTVVPVMLLAGALLIWLRL